jgi:SAM-dependent methyltransferase
MSLPAAECPLCGERTAGEHRAREMMLGTREPFHYGECTGCGTLVLLDPPADLGRFYPADYYSLRPPSRRPAPVRWLKRLRGEAALRGHGRLARLIGGGSAPPWMGWFEIAGLDRSAAVCDIGCGNGEILFDLAASGFADLVGADPLIAAPIEDCGVTIHRAEASAVEGSFDLVMLNHSFEHLRDPLRTLCECRRLLVPGGTVMLRTPVAGRWAWRHYGVDWVALDPPRHLFVVSPDGIRAAGARAGLDLYRTSYDSSALQFWASEQYRRDIGLFEPRSYRVDPGASPFGRAELRRWRREAAQLNAAEDGDSAAFFLRVIPGHLSTDDGRSTEAGG